MTEEEQVELVEGLIGLMGFGETVVALRALLREREDLIAELAELRTSSVLQGIASLTDPMFATHGKVRK